MLFSILPFLLAALVPPPAAPDPHCDPALAAPPGAPFGYRLRGDRCEGVYRRPLAGSAELVAIGFTTPSPDFAVGGVPEVHLRWASGASDPVRVRVQSVRPLLHYRMDSFRAPGPSRYSWSTYVPANLHLRRREIALLAWIDDGGPAHARVHLPLRADTTTAPRRSTEYRFLLVPKTSISDVRFTLRRITAAGVAEPVGPPRRLPGPAARSANQPFAIPISELPGRGLYEIEVAGRRRSGGSIATTFRFRHSDEAL